MKPVILIKLGGSIITDKTTPYTARQSTIGRLAKEIGEASQRCEASFVIGNGAGSFGHIPAKEYCLVEGKKDNKSLEGVAVTHNAAAQLNLLVVSALIQAKIKAISLAPASCFVAKGGKIASFFSSPFFTYLHLGLVPVVFGDVVSDSNGGYSILSTDTLLSFLAKELKEKKYNVGKVIHVGITDGVLDGNGKTIPIISSKNYSQIQHVIGKASTMDVTGGMAYKVRQAMELASDDIETWIVNGEKEGVLVRAVRGENVRGTIIKK